MTYVPHSPGVILRASLLRAEAVQEVVQEGGEADLGPRLAGGRQQEGAGERGEGGPHVSCLLSSWRAAAECEVQQLDSPAPGKAESLQQQRNVCIDPAFMRISDTEQGELLCKHIYNSMKHSLGTYFV